MHSLSVCLSPMPVICLPAVALVYYFFDPHGITDDPHLSTVITTTLVVVLISIVLFGAATKPLLQYLMGPADGQGGAHGHAAGAGGGEGGGRQGGRAAGGGVALPWSCWRVWRCTALAPTSCKSIGMRASWQRHQAQTAAQALTVVCCRACRGWACGDEQRRGEAGVCASQCGGQPGGGAQRW